VVTERTTHVSTKRQVVLGTASLAKQKKYSGTFGTPGVDG